MRNYIWEFPYCHYIWEFACHILSDLDQLRKQITQKCCCNHYFSVKCCFYQNQIILMQATIHLKYSQAREEGGTLEPMEQPFYIYGDKLGKGGLISCCMGSWEIWGWLVGKIVIIMLTHIETKKIDHWCYVSKRPHLFNLWLNDDNSGLNNDQLSVKTKRKSRINNQKSHWKSHINLPFLLSFIASMKIDWLCFIFLKSYRYFCFC